MFLVRLNLPLERTCGCEMKANLYLKIFGNCEWRLFEKLKINLLKSRWKKIEKEFLKGRRLKDVWNRLVTIGYNGLMCNL